MILLDALAGRPTPRRPVWIMRQAGRWLPEYRALRARHGFEELCASPELAAEVTLMPLRHQPFDAAIVFADLVSPLAALGIEHRFDPGPVAVNGIKDALDIARLPDPPTGAIAPNVFETLRRVRARLPGETALLGFTGGPFSLALYCMPGQGLERIARLRGLADSSPAAFDALLASLSELAARYVADQVEAGANAVQIFDTWAGQLDATSWNRVVRPHLVSLLEAAGRTGVPRIVFVRGAPHLVDAYARLPCEALSVDWLVDLAALRASVGSRIALQGNLDPAVLLGTPETVRARTRALLASVPARGHVVNLGHGILPETPPESVAAFVETVHEEARV